MPGLLQGTKIKFKFWQKALDICFKIGYYKQADLWFACQPPPPDQCGRENCMEKSRSWSSAHDWKSCIPQKGIEGSNPSFSATSPRTACRLRRFFFQYAPQRREKAVTQNPRVTAFFFQRLRDYAAASQNRMSMAATWALAASPWGVRVLSLVPLMMPAPQAHCMAGMAYSLKSPKSV